MTTESKKATVPQLPKRKHGIQHPASSFRSSILISSAGIEQRLEMSWVPGSIPGSIQKQKAGWHRKYNSLIPLRYAGGRAPQRARLEEASTIWGEEASSLVGMTLGRKMKSYAPVQ